ncbi:aminotransferase class I/II-fold pyridoxal phosphate-dependent enzyme [uncultured Sphaerochaeta sp.]|uniref:MalY/PatB family protein n=1 Tax=uncultured Sphaerochaeta sp. TaxID=886478 RepID=UPI002A0A5749|nr:aminotransferase class I/II-fold pyridoxal phosphate-dependent enzyme [uncultured Sphaerochaeta sp.]
MKNQDLVLIPNKGLSRLKWEYEQKRTSYDDLLCFGTADMDYASPKPILSALCEVVGKGHLGYPLASDTFYDAIHDWLLRTTSWDIDAHCCVSQNAGIYMSAWNILETLTRPGDKITILTPVHFCFKRMINLNGRVVIECPLISENGKYMINFSSLEACFTSGSKMFWLCNPHNPIGRAWSKEELQKIAELCSKYNVLIMSDDVYCGLVFSGKKYTPIASLSKKISYRTITLYSTSKCYNTTGLRHSFIVAENPELFKEYGESLEKVGLGYGLNIMGIAATIAAFNECDEWLSIVIKQIQKNYHFIKGYFAEHLQGAIVAESEATYFAWVDMRQLRIHHQQISYLIEQEEHIIIENGAVLGKGGAGFIRINLATSEENLREGAKRLKHFWEQHSS